MKTAVDSSPNTGGGNHREEKSRELTDHGSERKIENESTHPFPFSISGWGTIVRKF